MFQHGGADGEIFGSQSDAIAHGSAGMADFEFEIPQNIKCRLDHVFGPWGDFVGRQKQQVDVRKRGHLAAPVAADGQHGQPLAFGWAGVWVQQLLGGAHCGIDQTIGQI